MKKLIFALALSVLWGGVAYSECERTGSSFSRRSRDCDSRNIVIQNRNIYVFPGDPYPRHYYRYYPYYRHVEPSSSRREEEKGRRAAGPKLERGYAPGFGTSFPMPR